MKTAETKAVQEGKRAVQSQFSHFYKVMGVQPGQQGNALALLQRSGQKAEQAPRKGAR